MSQESILDRLGVLDTNTVSDALDFLQLQGAVYGLLPLWDCPKIVGRATTIAVGPKTDAVPLAHTVTPVIDAVTSSDRILVISGCIEGVSCWGDIVANAANVKNIRGTVLDGLARDIDGNRDIGYPVYGRGVTMISARNRVVQLASGEPVPMRGVLVHQDDYVIADRCGTVFIQSGRIEEVLELAERIDRRQNRMVAAVRDGHPVSDVMHDSQFDAIRSMAADTEADDNNGKPPAATETAPKPPSGKRPRKPASAEDQELAALFAGSDTAAVSDALDRLGIAGQARNIMPLADYTATTVGPAFTVRYVPAGSPPGGVGDFIDDVAAGDVVVIDNGGRTDCTVWGDIMTQYAGLRGAAGTVIDGACRDVRRALADGYPLFTAGRWMRTGKDRVQLAAVNEAVAIGRVRVQPRDIVVADGDGVVVVPRARAREVARVAEGIGRAEEGIRELIEQGATIAEAREKLGYHTLQRKQ